MIFNNVIAEDTDQLSNLHGIVWNPTGRFMHWLASIKFYATSEGYNKTAPIGWSDRLLVAIATLLEIICCGVYKFTYLWNGHQMSNKLISFII